MQISGVLVVHRAFSKIRPGQADGKMGCQPGDLIMRWRLTSILWIRHFERGQK
jgi:hypothetical protein